MMNDDSGKITSLRSKASPPLNIYLSKVFYSVTPKRSPLLQSRAKAAKSSAVC